MPSRRSFLAALAAGGAALVGLVRTKPAPAAGRPPKKTTTTVPATTTTLPATTTTGAMPTTTVTMGSPFVYDVLVLASDSNATAQSKINAASSNAVIGFEAGVHAERKVTGRLGQTYRGNPNGLTVFDGSRLVTGWSVSGAGWVASHTITDRGVFIDTTGSRTATGDDIGAQYPEELFYVTPGQNTGWTRKERQGQPTTSVPVAGKWTMDYTSGTLRVREDPTNTTVRISVTDTAIVAPTLAAGGMVIEDITFQKYATDIWHSAAGHGSDHRDWTYRRVAMIDNHGDGFYLGPGDTVTRCKSSYQGFEGMASEGEAGGYVAPITITDTEWSYNKRARYNWGWSGGGSKFDVPTSGTGLTIRNCWIHDNQGVGVWFDINLTETSTNTVESCLFERNEFADIDVEISNGTYIIRWNECRETGNITNNGGDPSQSLDVAILINNSRGCQVYENKLVDVRRGGIEADDDDRDPFLDGASFQRNHVKALGVGNGSYAAKLRFATNNTRIGTCGYDDNKYWSSASSGFRYAPNDLSFAGWQAVRTGPGVTGALDPNGQAGLTGTVTDPPNFVPFVAQPRYGPGV